MAAINSRQIFVGDSKNELFIIRHGYSTMGRKAGIIYIEVLLILAVIFECMEDRKEKIR